MATPTVRHPKWLGVTGEFWPDFETAFVRFSFCPQTESPRPTDPPISDRDFLSRPSWEVGLGRRTGWLASRSTSSRSSRLEGSRLTKAVSISRLPLLLRCIVFSLDTFFFLVKKRNMLVYYILMLSWFGLLFSRQTTTTFFKDVNVILLMWKSFWSSDRIIMTKIH